MGDKDATGYFGFANTMICTVFLISQSIIAVISPRILRANLYAKKKLYFLFSSLGLFYSIIMLNIYFYSPMIVNAIFDTKYDDSIELFRIMCFGGFFYMASTGPIVLFHRIKKSVVDFISGNSECISTCVCRFINLAKMGG